MADFDPESFAVRVSQDLFQVLSGRAAEPGPIEARSPREASLIEAVRKEAQMERTSLLRRVKEEAVKEAYEREQTEHTALAEHAQQLRAKLVALNVPLDEPDAPGKPCASFRDAILACYKVNGKSNPLACVGDVEAFTECAKQLSRISQ